MYFWVSCTFSRMVVCHHRFTLKDCRFLYFVCEALTNTVSFNTTFFSLFLIFTDVCRSSTAGGGAGVQRDSGRVRFNPIGLQHSLPVVSRLPLLRVLVRGALRGRGRGRPAGRGRGREGAGVRVLDRPRCRFRKRKLQPPRGGGTYLPPAVWEDGVRPVQPDHSRGTTDRRRAILLPRGGVATQPPQRVVPPGHQQLWVHYC